ncbi:MAG: hypothetical protein GY856_06405 [bacterium]|nr:hypothetical protein [bacterium]
MGNFSKPPLETLARNLEQGYVGLHLEQGVPVLDRDLNLLNDLIAATVRRVISRYIGDGLAAGSDGFAIQSIAADNDFRIRAGVGGAGTCLVGGIEVTIETAIRYSDQAGVPALSTPDATQPDPREDTIYLDVWLTEVDDGEDAELLNPDDVGIRTSVRLKPAWRVRVAEGIPIPDPEPGHTHTPLARLIRPRGESTIGANLLVDLRQTRLNLAEVERRLRVVEELSLIPTFAPSPNQFIPPVGAPGTEVRLFGRNFNVGTPRVLFGPREATVVGTPTATEIVATVPEDVEGLVRITVSTDGGTAVSDESFNVLPGVPVGDPPEFAASPQFIPPVGAASTPVRLLGNHFDGPNLHVAFGGEEAAVDSVTATQIIARVPAGISGQVTISVTTDFGSATSTATFQVL